MSTIVFPPSLTPAQATWELTHNVAGGSNPWGQVQRISRGSPVWSCSISMPTLAGEDMAIWEAFEAQAARGDVRFYMPHPFPLRGSFDNSELLVNGDFTNGTTGWSNLSSSTISAGSRMLRVLNNGFTGSPVYQQMNLDAGKAYVFVLDALPGSTDSVRARFRDDTTTLSVFQNFAAPSRCVLSSLAETTGQHAARIETVVSTEGSTFYIQRASLSRCLLVNGASQTGSSLNVDAGDASTDGLLKVGDMFTVMIDGVPSLHRLTRDLDTDSSGAGRLYFEPPLPGSPDDNAPIILRNPFCRMYIPSHNASSMYKPPMHGSFALEALEDPTRP